MFWKRKPKKPKYQAVQVTDNNFKELVEQSEVPVLLDFYADWCGPCKILGPIIDEIAEEYEGRALVAKVNTGVNPKLSQFFKIKSIPTIMFISQGKLMQRFQGLIPKPNLEEMLDEYIKVLENKKNSELEAAHLTEEEAIQLVQQFFKAFDTKDWDLMNQCLNETLELDYESFRGIPQYESTSADYIAKRKVGLEKLKTEHLSKNHSFTKGEGGGQVRFQFEIKRFEIDTDEYFHSYGNYEILIKKVHDQAKIVGIKQIVERNDGNKLIHGAFENFDD